ncbi:hypothetical protein B0T22DRAFT_457737 [Podospora appendiculata]|uniref:Uncharacterized protein n=1 Tax=Podospora appendiculata TaxID=314037 RepID=A0AAE0X869_9PEZI|nr:hypothetical protein B0T22DRAFT_457737 [Podospora appendiculata]
MRLSNIVSRVLCSYLATGAYGKSSSSANSNNNNNNNNNNGKDATCPERLNPYCCYSLDYSNFEVECVGPGKVESLSQCREYDPPPMCCCELDPDNFRRNPGEFKPPRIFSCDKDCVALDLDPDLELELELGNKNSDL